MSWDRKLTRWFNGIKPWQALAIIFTIGLAVFFSGLNGGFQGDDTDQIIKNEAVHSLSNIGLFFRSGTFWNGDMLVGDFYRPMMSTTFSFVYTFFGAQPIAFHVVQLILYMTGAFILFMFLKTLFKPAVALLASLIFLVHPINSQIVFSIPSMQEPLMFLFGISGLYVLSRSRTNKNFLISSGLLFLSLMSKETAVVFVCMAVLYVFLYDRERVITFIKFASITVILFLLLRINAVGFHKILQSAPVDALSLGERLIMIPSMIVFYIAKFVFPYDLATSYYWVYKTFTINGFLIPLLIVLVCMAGFVYGGIYIYKKKNKKVLTAYLFFAAWAMLGMAPHMQIIALDMTACETWFFCPITGFLGMIVLIVSVLTPKIRPAWILVACVPILIILGVRSGLRGLDYHSQLTLSLKDITVTEKNYLAMNNLAKYYIDHDKPEKAEWYARRSIEFYPAVSNYINLGVIMQKIRDFEASKQAYMTALKMVPLRVIYENIAIVNLSSGEPPEDSIKFLKEALAVYPTNDRLWNYLAIEEAAAGHQEEAKNAIMNAYRFGKIPPALYDAIVNRKPLDIPMPDSDRVVHIRWDSQK